MRWLIVLFLFSFQAQSQNYFKEHFGGSLGLVVNIGSHTNSLGISLNGFYTDYFVQFNVSSSFNLYHNNIGGRSAYWESRNVMGVILLAGKKNLERSQFFDALNHQTNYQYGIGYNYILYHDNKETSQRSGGFGMHINRFSIYHENDVFAGQSRDRFRTGQFQLSYRKDKINIGLGLQLWTGETRNAKWQKLKGHYHPYGFKILEDNPYGKTSHGLLFASIDYKMPYMQTANLRFGLDSEHVRHVIQNRLIHDLAFMPKNLQRSTPHYPRIDEYGCPVFKHSDARPNKLYFQYGANNNWSY